MPSYFLTLVVAAGTAARGPGTGARPINLSVEAPGTSTAARRVRHGPAASAGRWPPRADDAPARRHHPHPWRDPRPAAAAWIVRLAAARRRIVIFADRIGACPTVPLRPSSDTVVGPRARRPFSRPPLPARYHEGIATAATLAHSDELQLLLRTLRPPVGRRSSAAVRIDAYPDTALASRSQPRLRRRSRSPRPRRPWHRPRRRSRAWFEQAFAAAAGERRGGFRMAHRRPGDCSRSSWPRSRHSVDG